jgi:hypothetical protein
MQGPSEFGISGKLKDQILFLTYTSSYGIYAGGKPVHL